MQPTRRPLFWKVAAAMLVAAGPSAAATLDVGPGSPFANPADAARVAQDGDLILIHRGTYYACAVFRAHGLTIAGEGPETVMSDAACDGKAALVVQGNDTVVRDLTLARIRVADGNGAGIRAEGRNLRVERVVFVNNQRGILAVDQPEGRLVVVGCEFTQNGVPDDPRPSPAIAVSRMALLDVRASTFHDARGGAALASGASHTVVVGDTFAASGDPPPVQVAGPAELRDNHFALGAGSGARAAILITGSGFATLTGNTLANAGDPAALLLDWRGGDPALSGNVVPAGNTEVSTEGALLHQAKSSARAGIERAKDLARAAKRELKTLLGR